MRLNVYMSHMCCLESFQSTVLASSDSSYALFVHMPHELLIFLSARERIFKMNFHFSEKNQQSCVPFLLKQDICHYRNVYIYTIYVHIIYANNDAFFHFIALVKLKCTQRIEIHIMTILALSQLGICLKSTIFRSYGNQTTHSVF